MDAYMAISLFRKPRAATIPVNVEPNVEAFLADYSIEVIPRTAVKVDDFRLLLPKGTRVYLAHINGTPLKDMVATARRLALEGYPVIPHIPARLIKDRAMLTDWIARYQGEAGVDQALLIAGDIAKPQGDFDNSMQLLETGLFDKANFKSLHFAGHPETNRDIDPDGSQVNVMKALHEKQAFYDRTDAQVALVTQFCFSAEPIIKWADALTAAGNDIPIHIGVAGPARLQTLIRFSIACGVGASLRVLHKRARDATKLLLPFEPNQLIADLAAHKAANLQFNIEKVHFFPLGGIANNATWISRHGGVSGIPANTLSPTDITA
jgi:methylenetetrahydrofolate reductase (NADPH)